MSIKKYLSLDRLTEYDALIKAEIADGDASVKAYADGKADANHNHDDAYYTQTQMDEALAGKKDNDLVVTITGDYINGYTADKTVAEIYEAHNSGRYVYAKHNSAIYNYIEGNASYAVFQNIPSATGCDIFTFQILSSGKSRHTTIEFYTESEVDALIEGVNTSISNITNGSTVVKEAEHAASADSATTAENCTGNAATATKATQDGNGKVIADTYETKTDASAKLAEAKSYADTAASTAANTVKNDLLNGAGEAYDTLKELGELIDENVDAIDALETVAAGKADKEHNHNDVYYTIEQIDAMEFITIDDIDTICGSSIVNANEVIF